MHPPIWPYPSSIGWISDCMYFCLSVWLIYRCIKVVIAGASMERGRKTSSFTKLACNSLRCMKCNFKVHCFVHYSWDSSIDYMFLRNTVPNETKLSQKLLTVSGSSAYCCQCTWVSEVAEKELNPSNPAGPQWVCSGHWLNGWMDGWWMDDDRWMMIDDRWWMIDDRWWSYIFVV